MINYIIEASVCLACFYSIYWLFLRREKLLSINRFYLLATALISLIIPLLSFESGLNLFQQNQPVSQAGFIEGLGAQRHLTTDTPFISIGLVYGIGLATAVLLLLIKVVYAKRRIGKKLSLKTNMIEITETEGLGAYSFLNTIFIGKELSKNSELKEHIIAHESAHIEGMHSLDLFFFEVLKCVFWFNPFSYLYAKSIKLQHEYIADQHALEITTPASYQRSLLELTLSQVNSSLLSNFNEHPIETRLKMIQKLNSNVMNKLKTLFAVPVLALLFIAFACTETIDPAEVPNFEELEYEEIPIVITELEELSNSLSHKVDSMKIAGYYGELKTINAQRNLDGEIEISIIEESEVRLLEVKKVTPLRRSPKSEVIIEVIDEQNPSLLKELKQSSLIRSFEILKGGRTDNKKADQTVIEETSKKDASSKPERVVSVRARKH